MNTSREPSTYVLNIPITVEGGIDRRLSKRADRLLGKKPADPDVAAKYRAERAARKAAAYARRQPKDQP